MLLIPLQQRSPLPIPSQNLTGSKYPIEYRRLFVLSFIHGTKAYFNIQTTRRVMSTLTTKGVFTEYLTGQKYDRTNVKTP